MEPIFNILYLIIVLTMGITIIKNAEKDLKIFGYMAILLGAGDAFHLVPRIISMVSAGNFEASLGFGKLVTSITMTFFYVLLYEFLIKYYKTNRHKLTDWAVYGLAVIRIVLCLFPQNNWLHEEGNYTWEILRNIPFALLGIIILVFAGQVAKGNFKHLMIAIILSFGFYIPVVLWADASPNVGLLMIPKTMAYVWIVVMGFQEMRQIKNPPLDPAQT
ncbi:MAG: hypothetical protein WAV55_08280 [Clostridiaceae bacterium]